MPPPRLLLASGSTGRLALLRAAGLDPLVVPSGVDESGVEHLAAAEAVLALARRKAEAVANFPSSSGTIVLGCDSMFELDGTVRSKPESPEQAAGWWRARRGRTGRLHTGHHLIDVGSGRTSEAAASAAVRFGHPGDDEIDAYIATGEPMGLAGAFSLEGRSAPFVDGIDGDPGTVIGLSLPLLRRLLADLGHRIVDLWTP